MNGPGPLPRWFWLLPLLAIAAWWPLGPYWQSDDFLALHYAQDLSRALGDFAGPQYGSTDIWLFWRPLITLSFWLDLQIGGASPFAAHLSNVLAHGISTLLVALLWRRFLPAGAAGLAGLCWALLPGHAGSVLWAVGRVDSHTTVWCLLALLLFVRRGERRAQGGPARAWPMLLAFAAALASKELAFVVPALATALGALRADAAGTAARWRAGLRATAPLWALFAIYLGWRWFVLGRLGGYLDATYPPAAMARGFAKIVADLAVPLRWTGATGAPWPWLGAAGPLLALAVLLARRQGRPLLAAAALFAVAVVPMAGFIAGADNVHNLRYYYLPSVVLAGIVAAGGRLAALLWLAALIPSFVAVRAAYLAADRQSAAMHRALLREAGDGAPAPLFVAGLPHVNAAGTVVQLHFGVDRMLRPPFARGDTPLYALRPLAELPGSVRLAPPGEPPFALPTGSTWWFADPSALARVPAAPPALPDLPLAGDLDEHGVLDLSTARLHELAGRAAGLLAQRQPSFGLRTPGVKPAGYRVTIFTANGYLACLCPDHGFGGDTDGTLDVLRFLAHDPAGGSHAAVVALGAPPLFVADALAVPVTIDLQPEFPVLVEAGRLDPAAGTFAPTHRARRMLTFRFDRGYAAWVRLVQGR